MLAYLYGVITAGAVNQKFAVDVYGNMVYLQPAFAFACSAASRIPAVFGASAWVKTGEEYQVTGLQL